jgi:hypothetical protein
MATIRIVATDLVAQQLHQQALIENRTLSAMGRILLREGLEQRRAEQASREEVSVSALCFNTDNSTAPQFHMEDTVAVAKASGASSWVASSRAFKPPFGICAAQIRRGGIQTFLMAVPSSTPLT